MDAAAVRLDESSLDDIAELCARSLPVDDAPTRDELADALFAPLQPAVVRGDPRVGIAATVESDDGGGYLRLLVVDPAHRGRGTGRALLAQAEDDVRHLGTITTGADAPYYLFAGVPTDALSMLCLLERRHYQRIEANFNMRVDLAALPEHRAAGVVARPSDRDRVDAWMQQHWPNWRLEVLRALDKGTLVLADDGNDIVAFCAYDVNRRGLLGPIAARPDTIGRGLAAPLLLAALHRMRDEGRTEMEVSWVGPIVPYARVGATVSRVFFVYRKTLRPAS